MNFISDQRFIGAVRILPNVDTIGIPVFGTVGGNAMYIPEMDGDFKIVSFYEFYNEEDYNIERNIPENFISKTYSIGDWAPLPFWIDGKCWIVAGDAEAGDIAREFGESAVQNPVLADVRQLLWDARHGTFNDLKQRWVAKDITSTFSEIFYETPVHSKYWVTRFGDAVRYARSLTASPHPVDDEIRRIALDWISRFATKTDFERLMSIVGNLLDGAITSDRAQAMVFAFLINSVHTGNFKKIENVAINSKHFRRLFPQGIYEYWWKNQWPFLSFMYSRPRDILDPLIKEIQIGARKKDFRRAERLSYLYFCREGAPNEISNIVTPIFNRYMNEMSSAKYNFERSFEDPRQKDTWETNARNVLYFYHILMSLDGILNGPLRLSRTVVDRRFGMDNFYIKDLENVANI